MAFLASGPSPTTGRAVDNHLGELNMEWAAKTVLLDAKQGYHPEPEELEAEVELP